MKSISEELNLNNKRILLRLDLNVPLIEDKITDSTRIDKIIPTLKFLISQNAKIIIISHVGRPKGKIVNELSLKPICKDLEIKLNQNIKLISKDIKEIASKAIGEIIPSLKGKLEGVAMRVPTPNVSLIELVFCTKKEISKEKINDAFKKVSKNQLKKVIEITSEKLVSIDFNHNSSSAIVDLSLTSIVGKNMGKISAWYDNEWGFSNRMCDIAEYVHKIS